MKIIIKAAILNNLIVWTLLKIDKMMCLTKDRVIILRYVKKEKKIKKV